VLRLITFLPFSALMFMVPVLLAVCMVFACVPEVLYLLFGMNAKRSTSRKLKSFVPATLVNAKEYLGSTLHCFLSSAHNVVNTLLLPTQEQQFRQPSKRKALDRMFFMFLLMNHGIVSAKSARSSPVKPRPLPSEITTSDTSRSISRNAVSRNAAAMGKCSSRMESTTPQWQ